MPEEGRGVRRRKKKKKRKSNHPHAIIPNRAGVLPTEARNLPHLHSLILNMCLDNYFYSLLPKADTKSAVLRNTLMYQ
jgi:hypothetical protein